MYKLINDVHARPMANELHWENIALTIQDYENLSINIKKKIW